MLLRALAQHRWRLHLHHFFGQQRARTILVVFSSHSHCCCARLVTGLMWSFLVVLLSMAPCLVAGWSCTQPLAIARQRTTTTMMGKCLPSHRARLCWAMPLQPAEPGAASQLRRSTVRCAGSFDDMLAKTAKRDERRAAAEATAPVQDDAGGTS